jgi:hypothetical protein
MAPARARRSSRGRRRGGSALETSRRRVTSPSGCTSCSAVVTLPPFGCSSFMVAPSPYWSQRHTRERANVEHVLAAFGMCSRESAHPSLRVAYNVPTRTLIVMVVCFVLILAGASAALSPGGRCASALDCNATACANCACLNHTCTCADGWSGPQCQTRLPLSTPSPRLQRRHRRHRHLTAPTGRRRTSVASSRASALALACSSLRPQRSSVRR